MKRNNFIFTLLTLLLVSCNNTPPNVEEAEIAARNFAENFFNFDFKNAKKYCTEASRPWINLYVSNITDEDIQNIRKLPERPNINIRNVEKENSDSFVTAICDLENVYIMDSLGVSGQVVSKKSYLLKLKMEDGMWKVRMEGRLQNGK